VETIAWAGANAVVRGAGAGYGEGAIEVVYWSQTAVGSGYTDCSGAEVFVLETGAVIVCVELFVLETGAVLGCAEVFVLETGAVLVFVAMAKSARYLFQTVVERGYVGRPGARCGEGAGVELAGGRLGVAGRESGESARAEGVGAEGEFAETSAATGVSTRSRGLETGSSGGIL
jgi:hypothetical protein